MFRSIIIRASFVFVFLAALVSFAPTLQAKAAGATITHDSNTAVAVYNVCADETITLSGRLTTVTKQVGGFTDGRVIYSGFTGVGSDGTVYRMPYSQGSSLHIGPNLVQTMEVNYSVISRGSGLNMHVHILFHWTVLPSGEIVSYTSVSEVTCN